jgi:hypothetical protein
MAFEAPMLKPEVDFDPVFWRCLCGRPIWEHGRLGKDGNQLWMGCSMTACEKYRASDGSPWPTNNAGAIPEDPTDLHVDTEHWVDGQVVLSTDEPSL